MPKCTLKELQIAVITPLHTGHEAIPLYIEYTARNGRQNPQSSLCTKILKFQVSEVGVSQIE